MREHELFINEGLEFLRAGEYLKAEEMFNRARELSEREKAISQ
jgi:hypothetical protein